jgi:preprotein translocase subunit SecE
LVVCILSLEVFIRFNFLFVLGSILKVTKKVTYVISQDSISDHWKEKVVPVYALSIIKYSLQILLILAFIFFIFVIANYFFNNLIGLILSFIGIIESMVFAFGYTFLRKSLIK